MLDVVGLSAPLGVEVRGLDLRQPFTADQEGQLRALLDEHFLLLFRRQELTLDDQTRVLRTFGDIGDEYGDGTYHYFVSNVYEDGSLGEEELAFHSDWTWTTVPVLVASLYGVEVEGPSPPTRFANTARAYAALPTELQARLAGLEALHLSYQPMMTRGNYATRQRLADLPDDATPTNAPRVTNPVVLTHPRSGVPLLYVNPFFTSHVIDLPLEESDALLDELFERLRQPENVYEHEWEPGDIVIWDNLGLQHARSAFRGLGARRTLRRVSTTEGGASPRRSAGLGTARARPQTTTS